MPAWCPRCGYDLRGTTALCSEACPLTGTCPECGVVCDFSEILSPKLSKPAWCVEYTPGWLRLPVRSLMTFAMTFWPWGFWRSLKMTHEPRWRWVGLYFALLILPLYVALSVGNGVAAWSKWQGISQDPRVITLPSRAKVVTQAVLIPWSSVSPGAVKQLAPPRTFRYPSPAELLGFPHRFRANLRNVTTDLIIYGPPPRLWYTSKLMYFVSLLALQLSAALLCPLGFLALPVSRRRAKVRWRHVMRIMLYGLAALVPLVAWLCAKMALGPWDFRNVGDVAWWLTAGFVPVFLVVWWSVAAQRYLHMRHGWGVGLAVVVMAFLVGPTSLLVVLTLSI